MFSRFFIERPIFANVIAIVTMLVGGVALFGLPIEQYPAITPPTVQVTTSYPGANAEVVADTVASPIEQEVNGVRGHALHVVHLLERRLVQADGHVRNRHQPRQGPGAGAEPRGDRRAAGCPRKCSGRA